MSAEDALKENLMTLHSTGNLVGDNDEFVCIGQDWIPDQEVFRHLTWVPKVNIVEIRMLEIGKVLTPEQTKKKKAK